MANEERGIWTITPVGRELLSQGEDAVRQADWDTRRARAAVKTARRLVDDADAVGTAIQEDDEADGIGDESADITWRDQVVERVQNLDSDAFERLCARLLRVAGCQRVEVTRRSGDEGLDGIGVLELSLLSSPVFFQAKNHRRAIGPATVRELRGAMAGRGDKGILITSGTFTPGAREEAIRAGTPPFDLIDGERLCDLLLELKLGVEVVPVMSSRFFDDL